MTNIASVESMKGAPRIAPTPTPWEASEPPPKRIAMIGIIVSGRAVPTAARTDPTAPSASSSFRPNHSIPFVNSSAPIRMTTNAPMRMRMSTDQASTPWANTTLSAMTARMSAATSAIVRSPRRTNPMSAATTRAVGVAMTAMRPSHMKPAARR